MYFTDRGIEELQQRRGDEEVSLTWLAAGLQTFVDVAPGIGAPDARLPPWRRRVVREGG